MIRVSDKQVFYTHLLQQRSVTWPVERGISFIGCREDCHWGMALHVEHQMMPSEQFRHALAQRFGEARRYADYRFIFDPRQDFVIWRALPGVSNAEVSLEGIRRAQLTLAGFGHLFV